MISIIFVFCLVSVCSGEDNDQYRNLDIPEGSSCTWNDVEGRCTNILDCQSAIDGIKKKNHPPICSFQGSTPIVCCTDCLPDDSTEEPDIDFPIDVRFNLTTSKARNHCLNFLKEYYPCGYEFRVNEDKRQLKKNCFETARTPSKNLDVVPSSAVLEEDDEIFERVTLPPLIALEEDKPSLEEKKSLVERDDADDNSTHYVPAYPHVSYGEDAYFNQYPHMNQTHVFDTGHNAPAISRGVEAFRLQYPHMALLGYGDDALTAQWLCGGSIISEKFILTAAHCVSSPSVGPVKFIGLGILRRTDSPEWWQIHNVSRAIIHPEYKPPSKYHDIALLETEKPINFTTSVLPACLHLNPESDETAEATGWGSLGHHRGLADVLQTVKLQRYSKEKCSQVYPKHRHLRHGYDHSTQICYGDPEDPKDTCEGDSGGPLQIQNEYSSCAYTVIGVTSYGRQCGISAGSGMYTRVYHYVPWIESIVWP